MKSKIYLREVVDNKDFRFGQTLEYYPVRVEDEEGTIANALFPAGQIEDAIRRAETNIEDIPKVTFLESIFG